MSDQQNDRFVRPSESLSNSLNAMCTIVELFPSQIFFWKSLKFKISHCKNFYCPLSKISLHYQNIISQRLTFFSPTVQLDFRWTREMSGWQNDRFARPSESLSNSLNAMCTIEELFPSQKLFRKLLKLKIRHCKNFQCPLSKISLHYQTGIDQRRTVFHQLFSWTSVGPNVRSTKWSVYKAIWECEQFLECHGYYLKTISQKFVWKY